MRSHSSFAIVVLCGLGTFLCAVNAYAEIVFDTYSFVGVSGLDGRSGQELGLPSSFYSAKLATGSSSVAGYTEHFTGTTFVTAEARASAGASGGQLLRTYAKGSGTGAGLFAYSGNAEGVAAWRDVAYVQESQAPPVLRLNFALDGSLQREIFLDHPHAYANATAAVGWTTGLYLTNDLFDRRLVGNFDQPGLTFGEAIVSTDAYSTGGSWDTLEFTDSGYRGTFHIDVDFDQDVGGYIWGLGLSSSVDAAGGTATSDASHTLSLQYTSLPDGTRINAIFESGLTAVPEPSSWVLFLMATLIVAVRRRFKKISPQTFRTLHIH